MISTSGRSSSSARLPQRWNEIVPRFDSVSSAASSSTTGWSTVPPSLRARTAPDPLRDRLAGVLLVEAVLVDAAGEPLQHQRPVGEVAQQRRGDGVVVGREVALGDPVGGEQDSVGVGDLDRPHAEVVGRRHAHDPRTNSSPRRLRASLPSMRAHRRVQGPLPRRRRSRRRAALLGPPSSAVRSRRATTRSRASAIRACTRCGSHGGRTEDRQATSTSTSSRRRCNRCWSWGPRSTTSRTPSWCCATRPATRCACSPPTTPVAGGAGWPHRRRTRRHPAVGARRGRPRGPDPQVRARARRPGREEPLALGRHDGDLAALVAAVPR